MVGRPAAALPATINQMNPIEVPLHRESTAFARRLTIAVRTYGESRHRSSRRTNWSYRYASSFHAEEARLFVRDPDAYLAMALDPASSIEDVFAQRVAGWKVLQTLLKVTAHWIFLLLQVLSRPFGQRGRGTIYRKCYVDDIENVFDPDAPGVVRFIFPFPLNAGRQWRYLKALRNKRYPFTLAGYPYGLTDLIRFLAKRDIRALERLEARAQIRLGHTIRQQRNWEVVELSDEFDICSLDFVGAVRRPGLRIVNAAHGVGKYFPVHAYDEFRVLTRKQEEYYETLRHCDYVLSQLRSSSQAQRKAPQLPATAESLQLVFVSQTSGRTGAYLERCESEVLDRLADEFVGHSNVELLIKTHPNRSTPVEARGFRALTSLMALRSPDHVVFVSFFSTSHIDPSFRGTCLLLTYDLIRPGICFDDDGSIVTLDELVQFVRRARTLIE